MPNDSYNNICPKIWRAMLCCLQTDKSTTTFLKLEFPKKPICAYLILKHIGKYESFGVFSRFWIQFAIVFPLLLQAIISWFLFATIQSDVTDPNTLIVWNYLNITAIILLLLFFTEKVMFAKALMQLSIYRDDDGKRKFGTCQNWMYCAVQYFVTGWVYAVFIEPLAILDEDMFSVYFQTYGTLQKGHDVRLRGNLWVLMWYLVITLYSLYGIYLRGTVNV